MTIEISREDAASFLARYHFEATDIGGVLRRFGTVQYDPLNPIGRNPDLVFQARVPGYQVHDWLKSAYDDRLMYDAWDKQACLVPIEDWPKRHLIRSLYPPWHDREILESHPEAVEATLAQIDTRGPLSSLEFEDRSRVPGGHSWYGPTRVKRILRALWANGVLVTHHRQAGRHYYDRPERVIPAVHFDTSPLSDEGEFHRWIALRRHQAVGLLRPNAEAAVWSSCGNALVRSRAIAELKEHGQLTELNIQGKCYHVPSATLALLDAPALPARTVILGPLDGLLWDRKALQQIFDLDYVWEVYKPELLRKWGYYVVPVFHGQRFVARIDSRLEKGIWTISRWWWEEDVIPDEELVDGLASAFQSFAHYLRADAVRTGDGMDKLVAATVKSLGKTAA